MTSPKPKFIAFGITVAALVTITLFQRHGRAGLEQENQSLAQQRLALLNDNDGLSNRLARVVPSAPAPPPNYSDELMQLRNAVGALRRQTNQLQNAAAKAGQNPSQTPAEDPDAVLTVLPEDYPQTPQAATQALLGFFSRGDANEFFRYFGQPGGKTMYDQMFADQRVKSLMGMQVVSVGEPTTNSIASDILMVPYKVRLQDGSERERELRLAQDPDTQRWYFKGGL